jgi:hypothetical protein
MMTRMNCDENAILLHQFTNRVLKLFNLGDGGRGGNGGDGGRGGDGADGGSPAPGALAGRGGNVVVSTRDPKLLMLVECDVRGGFGGRGGLGGIPGSAGHGGFGGSGGHGGRAGKGGKEITTKDSAGKTVVVKKAGKPGKSGSSGSSGKNGGNGSSGRGTQNCSNLSNGPDGSVSFVVLDSNGSTLQQATERYNLTVRSRLVYLLHVFETLALSSHLCLKTRRNSAIYIYLSKSPHLACVWDSSDGVTGFQLCCP